MGVRELGAALVDLVLPADCAGCGAPVAPWCPRCSADLGPPTTPRLPDAPDVLAVGRYTGPLRAALLRYKERGRRDLARPLGVLLAGALDDAVGLGDAAGPGALWLVPAPSR
ncbi:ComF family protein, partial [Pseudonocardia zijingensis]